VTGDHTPRLIRCAVKLALSAASIRLSLRAHTQPPGQSFYFPDNTTNCRQTLVLDGLNLADSFRRESIPTAPRRHQ
jgi:hypothetical protein